MLTEKKLKLLILDDEERSILTVLKCAIRQHEHFFEDDAIAMIEQIIDVRRCSTVSEAIAVYPKFKPDLVFTDLKIENNDEPNPEIRKYRFQGLYFIQWLRKKYSNKIHLKVHSKHSELYEVKLELERNGISLLSNFLLSVDADSANELLKQHFPELLQQLAKQYFKLYAKNADLRSEIREDLAHLMRQGKLDQPIAQLGGFSARSLLAGWVLLDLDQNLQNSLGWVKEPSAIVDELCGVKPANRQLAPQNAVKNGLIEAIRQHPEYPTLAKKAQKKALEALKNFVPAWRQASMANLQHDAEHLHLNKPWLGDTRHFIDEIDRIPLEEHEAQEHYVRFLSLRLAVGGIYQLRQQLQPCMQMNILNCAVFGCIRYNSSELKTCEEKKSQLKKHLSVLGLSKLRDQGNPNQQLRLDSFFQDERRWLDELSTHFC